MYWYSVMHVSKRIVGTTSLYTLPGRHKIRHKNNSLIFEKFADMDSHPRVANTPECGNLRDSPWTILACQHGAAEWRDGDEINMSSALVAIRSTAQEAPT